MSSRELEECRQYFKRKEGFDRAFFEMKRKWKSHGKIYGKIRLLHASDAERKAFEGFFGRKFWEPDIVFSFSDFEKTLHESRFQGVSVRELLEAYFGENLITNQDKKEQTERKRTDFWKKAEQLLAECGTAVPAVSAWIRKMKETKQWGASIIQGVRKTSEAEALRILKNVAAAYVCLEKMEEDGIQLAVLSARITENPHYFDRGEQASQLLLYLLCLEQNCDFPKNAEEIQGIYDKAGVVLDEISSTVVVYGLHMQKDGESYQPLEAFYEMQEPAILSLANLHRTDRIWSDTDCVYVVENEMVFSHLIERIRGRKISLICTSGQPSRAAKKIIRCLCKEGFTVYYSGDMDPEGMGIADSFYRKYPGNIQIWRMSIQDYESGLSEEKISDVRMTKLQGIQNRQLLKTAEKMRQIRRASYQENILERLEWDMKYSEEQLVRIARRENNTKRSYLVVDPLQAKHVPAIPTQTLEMFEALADKVKEEYTGERLLCVGFAETATAIGAQMAVSLEVPYIQTTREEIPGVDYLFFSEEHSHASEQKLVKDDIDRVIGQTDRILFVEDEVTTGKTIRNIIRVLKEVYRKDLKFSVTSLLNGMTQEYLDVYHQEEISLHFLVKTDHSAYTEHSEKYACDGTYYEAEEEDFPGISVQEINGYQNARRLVNGKAYREACMTLSQEIMERIAYRKRENILVLGTEEFMYPAIFTGSQLEKKGCIVRCHATTRSPIAVSTEKEYPLKERYALRSLYDPERRTFLYDIGSYDQVLILTDANQKDPAGLKTLLHAVASKNEKITVFRWC